MFMATIGEVIGIAVLVPSNITDAKWSAGLGLAGTAIAGAGLAQSSNSEPDFSVKKRGDNLEVETPASEATDRH